MLVAGAALLSCPALASDAGPNRPEHRQAAAERALAACGPEAMAYFRVMLLARQFGDDGDVFEDALEDLHSKLADRMDDATGGPFETAADRRVR